MYITCKRLGCVHHRSLPTRYVCIHVCVCVYMCVWGCVSGDVCVGMCEWGCVSGDVCARVRVCVCVFTLTDMVSVLERMTYIF